MAEADDKKREDIEEAPAPAEAAPAEAVPAERDTPSYEALLDEYDRSVTPQPVEQQPVEQQPSTPVEVELQAAEQPAVDFRRIQQIEQRFFLEEVNKTADEIFGDLDLPRDLQLAWLQIKSVEIPQATQAFVRRNIAPRTWAQWKQHLSREAEKAFHRPAIDREATADRDGVVAAMRGASGPRNLPEPPPRYGNMSEAEFRKTVRDKLGFDPMA